MLIKENQVKLSAETDVWIRFAGLTVCLHTRYPENLRAFVGRYLLEDGANPPADLTVSAQEEDLQQIFAHSEAATPAEAENLAIFLALNRQLLHRDAFFLHAAVVAVDGEAFAFTARSGTGKSTHIRQWLDVFGSRACVVNGDKPFLFKRDGRLFAAGHPWCGKEGWSTDVLVPLKAICILERGESNKIRRADDAEVTRQFFRQVRMPENEGDIAYFLELVNWTMQTLPFYHMKCTISQEACKVAYHCMHEETT